MAEDRRQHLFDRLQRSESPITGLELARVLGVSRQVIVQDVALLRATGHDVLATPQGYVLGSHFRPVAYREVLACRHSREQTLEELTILVDLGIRVLDVIVEHPIYGELRGMLMLASREDVQQFIQKVEETGAELLSALTHGVHLHTVEAARPEMLTRARQELAQRGYLLTEGE